jgi:hypothetical protein
MITSHLPPLRHGAMTAQDIVEARKIRWEWILTHNRLRNTPGGGAQHADALSLCTEVITKIDALLADRRYNTTH